MTDSHLKEIREVTPSADGCVRASSTAGSEAARAKRGRGTRSKERR